MEEDRTPNNVCWICRKPIWNWYHGQGMTCGDLKCNEESEERIKKFNENYSKK